MAGENLSFKNAGTNPPTIEQLLTEFYMKQQTPKVSQLFEWEEVKEIPIKLYSA